jgi:ricin-type beta-trefoil lectin protein
MMTRSRLAHAAQVSNTLEKNMKAAGNVSQSMRAPGKLKFALCAATGLLALATPAFADACCQILNHGTNKCLDVRAEDNFYANGARVQQYHCTYVDEQRWKTVSGVSVSARIAGVVPDITLNYYQLVSSRSGKCMTVGGNASTENGAQIIQYDCNMLSTQLWHFENVNPPPRSGAEEYHLVNLFSGKCLDLDDDLSADGAKIQIWDCNYTVPAQQWYFQFVSNSPF